MPTEPADSTLSASACGLRAYPTREAGGMVWAYLGPRDRLARSPSRRVPRVRLDEAAAGTARDDQGRRARRTTCRRSKASIDSSHSWFLHRGILWDWKTRSSRLDRHLAAAGSGGHGLRVPLRGDPQTGRRIPTRERYVRVTLFVVPFTALIPRPIEKTQTSHVQIFVPIDDTHTMFYGVFFSQDGSPVDERGTAAQAPRRARASTSTATGSARRRKRTGSTRTAKR